MACNPATCTGTGEAVFDPQNPGADLYREAFSKAYSDTRDQAKIQCNVNNPGHADDCGEPVFVGVESIDVDESRNPPDIKIKVKLKIKWNCQKKAPTEAEKNAAIVSGCGTTFTVKAISQAADATAAAAAAKGLAGRIARMLCMEPCTDLVEVGPATATPLGGNPPSAQYDSTYKCTVPAAPPPPPAGGPQPPPAPGKKGGGGCLLVLPAILLHALSKRFEG